MSKRYLRDPNVNVVADLVSEDEVESAFQNTNFGHTDFRGLLAQGCIKALAGWHQGHTITCSGLRDYGVPDADFQSMSRFGAVTERLPRSHRCAEW
nr:hypothetical protein [uncultured Pseudomonas sp.]